MDKKKVSVHFQAIFTSRKEHPNKKLMPGHLHHRLKDDVKNTALFSSKSALPAEPISSYACNFPNIY
jgi:hypothetical protein